MILDNEQQRAFLLELLSLGNYPGKIIDFVCETKRAIEAAPTADGQTGGEAENQG